MYYVIYLGDLSDEVDITFAVPTQKILQTESDKFCVDGIKPGVIKGAVQAFAQCNNNKDVKVSIDGKKLAFGFGKS